MEEGTMVAITMVFAPILILVVLVATLISDIGNYIFLGGLFLFFLIIGIALITGHAIGMVAGVNSMTESFWTSMRDSSQSTSSSSCWPSSVFFGT